MGETREKQIVRSTCRLCYNNCGILIDMENNRPVRIKGDPSNPVNKGALCRKGLAALEYLDNPYRLKHPLRRSGKRGEGNWERISWHEALNAISHNFLETKKNHGPSSIQIVRGGAKGMMDRILLRFTNLLGTPNFSSMASVCFIPGEKASMFTYGYYAVPDFDHPPACIMLWACDPASSSIAVYADILKAKKRSTKLIVIDPLRSELAARADLWIRLRPGTDLALALGMMNVIINENLYDESFVRRWTVGFDELRNHVQDYPPERVSELSWADKEKIVQAARMYALKRPGCLHWGNGIDTNLNSFQTCRGLAILRSITGNLGIPGGEVKWSGIPARDVFPIPFPPPINIPTNKRGGLKGPSCYDDVTCQDRISPRARAKRLSMDDNLAPFVSYVTPPRVVESLINGEPYPIRSAYIMGGNILLSYPNSLETLRALQNLDFLTVADMFMTPTAMLADILLPVATHLEFDSIEAPCHVPIASIQQKVATVGECRSDVEILNDLAKRLRLPLFWKNTEEILDWTLEPSGISFEQFREEGILSGKRLYSHYESDGFDTSTGKVELFSEKLKEWNVDPLPVYHELPETPFSAPALSREFPLIAVNKKSAYYKHSRDRQIPSLRRMHPEPIVRLHINTAGKVGIGEGDLVYIETKRGCIKQKAKLIRNIDPRVVEIDYGWYFPEKKERDLLGWDISNMNILTDNRPPFNREMGSTNLRGFCCRVYKCNEAEGSSSLNSSVDTDS